METDGPLPVFGVHQFCDGGPFHLGLPHLVQTVCRDRDRDSPAPTSVWTLENYLKLPRVAPFVRFFLNSIIVSGVSTFFVALGSAACGYVFAKYRFRGRDFLFFLVISTILIPLQTYIVPLYLLTWKLGWINSYQGLIFPLIIMSSGIFFLRQNIMSIPDELIDAARVDGATEWKVFRTIVLPLSLSPIAAISIVNWVYTWSLFIWPLIVANSTEMFTVLTTRS